MNPSSLQTTSTEIRKLLESLNGDNYDSVVHQLSQYTEYGTEESILLVQSCLHHFKIYKKNLKSLHLEPAVVSLFKNLMEKPHFCKVFSGLVEHISTTINEEFLDDLSTSLKLSPFEKLAFGLALSNSENNNVRIAGWNFCMAQFKELCQTLRTPQNLIEHEVSSPVLLKDSSMSRLVLNLWHANCSFFSRALNATVNLHPENMNRVVELLHELEKSGGIWESFKEAAPNFPKVPQEQTNLLSSNQLSKEMESVPITSTQNSLMIENISDTDSSTFEVDADHIGTEANAYFQLMFSGQLAIGAMVQMLTRFMRSSQKREKLVYKHMINNLLQVNKFLTRYPDEHFNLAILFGLLIRQQVMSDSTLNIALQVILDALNEPTNSKTFIFGTKALENFVDRLIEWPEYSQKVLEISQLRDTNSELVSIIERTLGRTSLGHSESNKSHNPSSHRQQRNESNLDVRQKASLTPSSQTNPNLSTSGLISVATSSGSVSIQKPQSVVRSSTLKASSPEFSPPSRASSGFVSTSIGTLLAAAQKRETPIKAPPSKIRDKISVFVNTLSATNIEAKAKEFTEILEEQYYPWFAQYIVLKRASIEPNYHMLYINFFEKVNSKQLMKEIVQETYENCKVLLRSELIQSSIEERSLLRNLGSWLGKITIGRNKVLLSIQIDPKSLIIEAYEKGLMIGIIPFTSMVLEPCKGSLAYQPPNPWTMGILGLLAEIHAMPNIKAYLKFSIEVLFKNLELDIKEVTPTSLLKDRVRKIEGNPDFSNNDVEPCKQNTSKSSVNQDESSHVAATPSYKAEDINMIFQRVLPMVMDTAIKEIVSTIVESMVSIATQTTMALVLKDYVTDMDENFIHSASSSIIVSLVGNFSYVTSKEPLRIMMSSQLKTYLQSLNIASESLEHDMKRVIDDNLELCCELIEKAAVEKGLMMVKKEVDNQLSFRRNEREGSRPETSDPNLHAQGNISSFPRVQAPVSHASGPSNVSNGLGVQQQTFLQPSASRSYIRNTIESPLTTGAALDEYQILANKIKLLIDKAADEAEIQAVIAEVHVVILRCINKDEAALVVAQTVFEGLYKYEASNAHINAHVAILAAVCDVSKLVGKELTGWVLHSDDERKFNKDITVGLIHRELLNLTEYDAHMARLISAGKSGAAMEFCISLVTTLEASDARILSTLQNVVNALAKVANHPVARRVDDGQSISIESDPPGFQWQVCEFWTDWCQLHGRGDVSDASRANYVQQLNENLFSKVDDYPKRFFRLLLELSVLHYLSFKGTDKEADTSSFIAIDVYTDLVFTILKFCPLAAVDQGSNKLTLFSKLLGVIVRVIRKDAEEKKESFISTPYFRLFINFFNRLGTLDSAIDDANFQFLAALSNSLRGLQPLKVPAFSFTWVELISHKDFMTKLFAANGRKGWPYVKRLLVDLLRFMEPFLRNGQLTDPVRVLYKGTLKVLAMVVHDFPEFICYYHFNFCQVIAPRCIQLRNIIVSAYPRNMRLPDPTTPNLKVDLLPEMSQPPCIAPAFPAALKANKMINDVDEYLMMRPEESSFLFGLNHKLLLSSSEAQRSGTCYNVPLLNSLVLYVGTKAIQQLQVVSSASHETSVSKLVSLIDYYVGAALDIFRALILYLDSEGRYLFFNAVADQLRYPNNHMHFFSFVMLHFFVEINEEAIQEQITRVLLERLITKIPHPWGVQVTFLELVKNPRYNFWNLNFTKSDPEIKRVFDSVSTAFRISVPDVADSGHIRG